MASEPSTNLNVRDLLIEHMDGTPVTIKFYSRTDPSITHGERAAMAGKRRIIGQLIFQGYLKTTRCEDGIGMETVITDKGRLALARALANWADALCKVAEPSTPLYAFHTSLWGDLDANKEK